MPRYIRQLTRENTLIDRAFRTLAYAQSIPEIGKAKIAHSPIVGFGRVTSLYYDPVDYKRQQSIIVREFSGQKVSIMSNEIIKYLELGYTWAKSLKNRNFTSRALADLIKTFNYYHAHSRGAIVYGYWGEPIVTGLLKKSLKVKKEKVDETISILSVPHKTDGSLKNLYQTSSDLIKKKEILIKSLRLTAKQQELVEILSWFTLFYEIGERVSGYMYNVLLSKLSLSLKGMVIYKDLDWYDPYSLLDYLLTSKKLSRAELNDRKNCYILLMEKSRLRVVSGKKALTLYNNLFKEKINTKVDEIKGTIACTGLAKGIVKIVITKEDQKKFKRGNILMSTMTTPGLMGAIQKAAAIVTDEGGMTAHAAIVSRELNIPCIVGTEIATKVFKDGDKVEVDAGNGIIRKL